MLDFEKAFDRINIAFLLETLRVFNFGDKFRQWIKILYSQISSCVTNNGHASSFFNVTRGIRQGCPISAMLFILVVELLSAHIKQSPNIRGITINNDTFVITQLADDTTLFVNDEESIRNAITILDRFYESLGLRITQNVKFSYWVTVGKQITSLAI